MEVPTAGAMLDLLVGSEPMRPLSVRLLAAVADDKQGAQWVGLPLDLIGPLGSTRSLSGELAPVAGDRPEALLDGGHSAPKRQPLIARSQV